MELENWSANLLKKDFEVTASFYQIKAGDFYFRCRNHAVIRRKGYNSQKQPDALIVMANPGSCKPSEPTYEAPLYQDDLTKIPYVPVNIDPTQYQLMRLMKLMDWNEISIINLSDLCAGNMDGFKKRLKWVHHQRISYHSIFSKKRTKERMQLLSKSRRIILAWGKNTSINKLASYALKKIPNENLYGLKFPDMEWAYRHPNPMLATACIAWLEDMKKHLTQVDTQNNWEPIIKIGGEGGSITLLGYEQIPGLWVFTKKINEIFDDESKGVQKEKYIIQAYSWEDALQLIKKYPWPLLSPLYIHPLFREKVWGAVNEYVQQEYLDINSTPQLLRWKRACFPSHLQKNSRGN